MIHIGAGSQPMNTSSASSAGTPIISAIQSRVASEISRNNFHFISGAVLPPVSTHRTTGARIRGHKTRSRVRAPFHHNITSGECAW